MSATSAVLTVSHALIVEDLQAVERAAVIDAALDDDVVVADTGGWSTSVMSKISF